MLGSGIDQLLVDLSERVNNRYYGKYRGVVSNVDDPEKVGRVRARVPKIFLDVETQWATPCAPYTGDGEGLFLIPPVGAGVWIEFEEGDLNRPIWSGGWWNKDKTPKNEQGDEAVTTRKILRSNSGLLVAMDDDAKKISISDSDEKNFITIEVMEGKIKIQATTKVVVESPQIELVENASHPLVYGDDLLNFLNQMINIYTTHTHPGETALGIPVSPMTPMPPMTPATPALLSVKVKTG